MLKLLTATARNRWLQFYKEIISSKNESLFATVLRAVLRIASLFYLFCVIVRIKCYQFGLFKIYRPEAFVISIGNITAGGTGKTPFTIFLARQLKQVAVLTRGYKSQAECDGSLIKVTDTCTVSQVGDEALLIKKKVPGCSVYVCPQRSLAAERAVLDGARFLLLDDGMQHCRIARDINICLIDALNPFGYGYLLPRGLLREPLSMLKRADLLVITRAAKKDTEALEQQLQAYSKAPIVKVDMQVDSIVDLYGNRLTLEPGTKVALFSAIGCPEGFYETVASLDLEIIEAEELPDHETFDLETLRQFYNKVKKKGASHLLCTEKDSVKLAPSELPIACVLVQMKILSGQDQLFNLLPKFC